MESILEDINLTEKGDAITEKLSGGQKRKLSVGKEDVNFVLTSRGACPTKFRTPPLKCFFLMTSLLKEEEENCETITKKVNIKIVL